MEYKSIDEILNIAKLAEGKSIGEIDSTGRSHFKTKGMVGHIIEESLYHYPINSESEADFPHLGIELKSTAVRINKNKTLSAKERLVLNIINYMEEAKSTFYDSSFWKKNKTLLLIFYLWIPDIEIDKYKILKSMLYNYPEEDLEIIKQDWQIIHQKIVDGKAHEISEADTLYLGACTKGASASSIREQPNSNILAKQRAYSLKQSYMTSLVRQYFHHDELIVISDSYSLKKRSFEEILHEKFSAYFGMTFEEISTALGLTINQSFKAKTQQLASGILGIKGVHLNNIAEFQKANIQLKTIRLEPNGLPKEHMSFEQVNFEKWLEEDFEDSQLFTKFEETKFLFVVFEYKETLNQNPSRQLYFKKIKLWNMPMSTIKKEVFDLWYEVKQILIEGVKLVDNSTPRRKKISNNLPGQNFNEVVHLRPKATDGNDQVMLPDGQKITKQAYWLDRRYISNIINNEESLNQDI